MFSILSMNGHTSEDIDELFKISIPMTRAPNSVSALTVVE